MKVSSIATLLLSSSLTNASILQFVKPEPTQEPLIEDYRFTTSTMDNSIITSHPYLNKREAGKKVIIGKEYLKEQELKNGVTKTTEVPAPWLRTIYGSIHEVVTPTVIGAVTFNTKPPLTTDGLEPWVSLKDDGSPKTIKPKMNNGKIKNGRPDYKTYFQTASTVTYSQQELKAHNLKDNDVHTEVVWLDEDDTYVNLSPLMRCIPDLYRKKGPAGVDRSEPFCSPKENSSLRVGLTYFVTWYTRYFEGAENVKFHFAYVKEAKSDKGMKKKREIPGFKSNKPIIDEASKLDDLVGDFPGTFYSSDWILNRDGYFPIEVDEDWLQNKHYKKVMIAIQPDTIEDEDFSLLDSDHIIVNFQYKATVAKNSKLDKHLQDQTGTNDDVYYVIMAVPTVVIIASFGMYVFLHLNRKHRDLSHIKKPKRSRYGNNGKYNLPYALTDMSKPDSVKRS